jgi:hypothetical protein
LARTRGTVIVACVAGPQRPDGVPEEVLTAFGLADAVPRRLAGGQGTAWRAGPAVLKPVDSVRDGRWFADVYDTLDGPGFRVPRPVRAVTGDWVALGWAGYQWVAGAPADWSGVSPRWPELVAVSRALHAALAGLATPSWRRTVENPWTIGDAVAWGERDPEPLLGQLLARALIYRLVTEIVMRAGTPGIEAAAHAAGPVTDLVAAYCSA